MSDGSWYLRSELADCGGTATQVSLADFTYGPSVSFELGGSGAVLVNGGLGWGPTAGDDKASVSSGSINFSSNGNWSTPGGELVVTMQSVGTDSFHTTVSCTVPGLTVSWYCQPGQNLVQNPTCSLGGGSGTSSSLAASWGTVLAARLSSSTVNCNVSCRLE
jgi:hypothetical protein